MTGFKTSHFFKIKSNKIKLNKIKFSNETNPTLPHRLRCKGPRLS